MIHNCLLSLSPVWLVTMESYFSSENNGISFKVSKKKKRDQQTAVFIKLIFMSYSDVLLSNFLPRLVAITHSQSLNIVLKRDRIIEQIFFNNQANCNKWTSFVIGQSKGTNAILFIVPSIWLSRITKKKLSSEHIRLAKCWLNLDQTPFPVKMPN